MGKEKKTRKGKAVEFLFSSNRKPITIIYDISIYLIIALGNNYQHYFKHFDIM